MVAFNFTSNLKLYQKLPSTCFAFSRFRDKRTTTSHHTIMERPNHVLLTIKIPTRGTLAKRSYRDVSLQPPPIMLMFSSRPFLAVLVWLALVPSLTLAQRFLREGFSNQMESDFRAEAALGEDDVLSGMTREMFLMQDLEWEIEPPSGGGLVGLKDRGLKRHVEKYIQHPIHLKLTKRQGKYGLRAIGTTEGGKKLRAFWRQGNVGNRLKASDLLEASYDDAVKSRLFTVEFELQLPQYKRKQPAVVYQVAVEGGGMNPKAMVPRGGGTIKVYPAREKGAVPIIAGAGPVGLRMKAGLVDPSWSRGRTILRTGKSTGFI